MKIIRFVCFLMFVITLARCKHDQVENEASNLSALPDWEIEFYDTIFLSNQSDDLIITEIKNDKILSFSDNKKEVFIFDRAGNEVSKFNKKGPGPEEYTDIVQAGFTTINDICLTDYSKIYIYNIHGQFIKSCPYISNVPVWPNVENNSIYFIGDSMLFSSMDNNYSADNMDYFKKTHLFGMVNTSNCSFTTFGEYDQGGLYTHGSVLGYLYSPDFFYSDTDRKIFTTFPLEKKVYIFDILSKNKVESFTTFPEYFFDLKRVKETDPQSQLLLIQTNSFYQSIRADNDFVFLLYTQRKPQGKIWENVFEEDGRQEIFFKRNMYLEIYDKKGQKLCHDILVSDYLVDMLKITSLDEIVFHKLLKKDSSKSENNALIYARIKKNI